MGAKKMIFAKDERGLFTDNPKKNRKAKFIPRISAQELIQANLPDLAVEREVIKMMINARFAKEIQIINSHKKGNLTRALNGESVGTIIYS
jgi:molybdenum storage protein